MPIGYIAIDLGAESGRTIVGVLDSGRLQLHELHRFAHVPFSAPTGLHWDITGLWREICAGLQAAAHWAAREKVQLASVGIDTWGVDFALIGQSGELLGLPHAYRDPRNQAAFESAAQKLGEGRIYQSTGAQLLPFNTLFALHAENTASPETVRAADRLLMMPDLFHYWLSGVRTNEATIASTSQMLDARTCRWVDELLDELQIPSHILAPLIPPGTVIGPLLADLAQQTGLPSEVQVIAPAAHDTASAIAAVPASEEEWCFLSSGTWSLFGAELYAPCINSEAQAAGFANELGVGDRIRFLKVLPGMWLIQQCRLEFAQQGRALDYAELTQLATEAEPFRTKLDPSHADLQTAGDVLTKIARFAEQTGQPEPRSPGEFVRACLEGLASSYKTTLSQLESILGRRFTRLHVVGGGAKNGLLNQMIADVTGLTVIAGPFEATAAGNALTQAMALGHVKDLPEIRRIIGQSFECKSFEPSRSQSINRRDSGD